jgi:hypothetical protein
MGKKQNKQFAYLKKGISGLTFFLIFSVNGLSQNVGISPAGATPPNTSAGLDINFSTKGLLIPRVALTGTANSAPLAAHIAGMVVYNTATVGDLTPGFYFNNGTKWVPTLPKANVIGQMQYWDGITWINIPSGTSGQRLRISASGVPVWGQ